MKKKDAQLLEEAITKNFAKVYNKIKRLDENAIGGIVLQQQSGNIPYFFELDGHTYQAAIAKVDDGTNMLHIVNPVAENLKKILIDYLDSVGADYEKDWTGSVFVKGWDNIFKLPNRY